MTDDTYHDNSDEYSWRDDGRPSLGLVNAVAAATDRAPRNLPQLGEFVDPDALDALLASDDITITFEYADTTVTAHGDGTVLVS
jgi:hypothetical protein